MFLMKKYKEYLNPHHLDFKLAKTVYYFMVNIVKNKVLEEDLDFLKYAR